MISKYLFYLASILFLTSCESVQQDEDNPNIVGLWSLEAMDIQDSAGNWHLWNGGMQGFLLYDNAGHGALHLLTKGYEDFDIAFNHFEDSIPLEALHHLNNSYVYIARYEIDEEEGIVKHERISHSNPGEWGEVVERKYWFSGDTLVLQPVEDENASLRLKWLREE